MPDLIRCRAHVQFLAFVALAPTLVPSSVKADVFDDFVLKGTFDLPSGADVFDVLTDGRIVVLAGADVYVETTAGSRDFALHGALPEPNLNPFAAFVRVSPDGTKMAVGDNLDRVGIFEITTLSGSWFTAFHFDAEWYDDTRLALSGADLDNVTLLDITSPDPLDPINPVIIENINGAPAGIAFDSNGNLYTGNGLASGDPEETGEVRVFDHAAWTAVLEGGTPLDFFTNGTLVVDILSAASLGFDVEGNLHVGGGDFIGGTDVDFAALVRASAVRDAIMGLGPADPNDPADVRQLDPDSDSTFNFYTVNYNSVTEELYLMDFGATRVYVYAAPSTDIPTVSEWGLVIMILSLLTVGTLTIRRRVARVFNP
ncbi:MAG: hypothetical protein WBE26_18385 [Phycisphaerae bacterium]